jgi:hypothetical protein
MKKIILTLIILASVLVEGIAQEKLKIGDVTNGKLKITNESDLRAFYMNNINNSGNLDKEIKTDISPSADRIFAYLKVTGNKGGISSIGVLLVNIGNEAFIVANEPDSPGIGGSATVTCAGNPCTSCYPTIEWISGNWLPIIVCGCNDPGGHCNMTVTFTVTINTGSF